MILPYFVEPTGSNDEVATMVLVFYKDAWLSSELLHRKAEQLGVHIDFHADSLEPADLLPSVSPPESLLASKARVSK